MQVWKTEEDANDALDALENARKFLDDNEYEKFKNELIQVALKSYTKAKIHFFQYLK